MRTQIRPSCGSSIRGLLSRFIGSAGALASVLLMLGLVAAPSNATAAGSPNIVIAEAYGGGGNSGATLKNDFIVLFNRGSVAVDITGWSVQYGGATGSTWQKTDLTNSIPAGGYYLVQEAAGSGGTTDLPTPDAIGTIAMSGTGFKVALCNTTNLLTGACPTGGSVVDYLGANTNANCYEGSGPAPGPSNTTSVQRQSNGCLDEDNNATDFVAGVPSPRNSGSPYNVCPSGDLPPSISSQPLSLDRIQGETAVFAVAASGTAPLTYQWYKGVTPVINDARISGATSNVLTISGLVLSDAGSYTVKVNNSTAQPATSDPATLTVGNPAPVFRTMPVNQTVFAGSTASFSVAVYGVGPFTYQWYKEEAPLSDGGQYSGTHSAVLTIANVSAANAGNYKVVVTGSSGSGSATSDFGSLALNSGTTGVLARWGFNLLGMDPLSPPSSEGDALAVGFVSNNTNAFQAQPGTAIDPVAMVGGTITNYYWGSASYPAANASNKTAGLGFKVSTAGKKNIQITFAQRASPTASKYTRLQYTTNGSDFIDYPSSTMFAGASTWESRSFDLSGFAGVHNNANFAFRIVSEFESTATYGASNNANYVGATSGYGSGGTLSLDYVTVNGELLGAITPSTLQPIADKSVVSGSSLNVSFTITGSTATSVEVNPVDSTIASGYGITSGSGGTITLNGSSAGATPVIVKVTDANGNYASGSFLLTVTPLIAPPNISSIPATNTLVNTPVTIPFKVWDAATPANSLTLGKQSFNTTLVPLSNIVFGGSGSNRTVTITPVTGTNGTAPIVISVTNNAGLVTSTSFRVLVRATATTLMVENFDYDVGSVTATSAGYWQSHSGTAGQVDVLADHSVQITQSESEDVNARIFGAPYSTNSPGAIWSSLVVKFSALPTASGTYFAHLKDDETFNYADRLFASTQNAAAGSFRVGVANTTNSSNLSGQFPLDLQLDTAYTIVTKTMLSNGVSTIWINPTGPGSPNVTATNDSAAINVSTFALRQATGEGIMKVDSIRVGLAMSDVVAVTEVQPIPLAIVKNTDGSITLNWSDASFKLQESTTLAPNSWTDVNGAASGYTLTPGGTKFYRLISP